MKACFSSFYLVCAYAAGKIRRDDQDDSIEPIKWQAFVLCEHTFAVLSYVCPGRPIMAFLGSMRCNKARVGGLLLGPWGAPNSYAAYPERSANFGVFRNPESKHFPESRSGRPPKPWSTSTTATKLPTRNEHLPAPSFPLDCHWATDL